MTNTFAANHCLRAGVVAIVCLSAFFTSPNPAAAQKRIQAVVDTGFINGAHYRIDIPVNLNRNLVLFAHGYNAGSFLHGERAMSLTSDPRRMLSNRAKNNNQKNLRK